jgi:cytochrome c-type biogenesis protein CcsB
MSESVEQLIVSNFGVVFWLYLGAMLMYIAYIGVRRRVFPVIGLIATTAGFTLHTIAIVGRWAALGRLPLSTMYEYSTLLAWGAVLVLLLLLRFTREPLLGAAALPAAVGLIALASLLPARREMQLVPALQSYWLKIHVSVAILAEAAFAVACGMSIAYLIKASRAGMQDSDDALSLRRLDDITYRLIAVGYPLFTIGALFAGAIWAKKAWGTFWGWDPKEVATLVVWLVYSIYLHARRLKRWQGRPAAVLSITGFALVIFTFLANYIFGGLHSYQ